MEYVGPVKGDCLRINPKPSPPVGGPPPPPRCHSLPAAACPPRRPTRSWPPFSPTSTPSCPGPSLSPPPHPVILSAIGFGSQYFYFFLNKLFLKIVLRVRFVKLASFIALIFLVLNPPHSHISKKTFHPDLGPNFYIWFQNMFFVSFVFFCLFVFCVFCCFFTFSSVGHIESPPIRIPSILRRGQLRPLW